VGTLSRLSVTITLCGLEYELEFSEVVRIRSNAIDNLLLVRDSPFLDGNRERLEADAVIDSAGEGARIDDAGCGGANIDAWPSRAKVEGVPCAFNTSQHRIHVISQPR